eukprot:8448378-Heterocapsa_arctica.AAC.1
MARSAGVGKLGGVLKVARRTVKEKRGVPTQSPEEFRLLNPPQIVVTFLKASASVRCDVGVRLAGDAHPAPSDEVSMAVVGPLAPAVEGLLDLLIDLRGVELAPVLGPGPVHAPVPPEVAVPGRLDRRPD